MIEANFLAWIALRGFEEDGIGHFVLNEKGSLKSHRFTIYQTRGIVLYQLKYIPEQYYWDVWKGRMDQLTVIDGNLYIKISIKET